MSSKAAPSPVLPASMRFVDCAAVGDPEVMIIRHGALPTLAAGEVLINVHAAGVNRPDILQRRGLYPMPAGVNPVLGLEVAGEIVAITPDVSGWQLGDRVCALTNGGGYADYCAVPSGQCLPMPIGLSMQQAAAIPETFFTVWANLIQLGHARAGERVLIHGGSSGIGTTALLLGRELGLRCFATAGSKEKCQLIEDLGGVAVNYREHDFAEAIVQLSDGKGVDVILDIVGANYLEQNLRLLANDGRLVIIGMMGGISATLNLMPIMLKRLQITGSTLRARSSAQKAAIAEQLHARVWPALAAGRCLPVIDQVFPLARVADAHRHLESGAGMGKVVLSLV